MDVIACWLDSGKGGSVYVQLDVSHTQLTTVWPGLGICCWWCHCMITHKRSQVLFKGLNICHRSAAPYGWCSLCAPWLLLRVNFGASCFLYSSYRGYGHCVVMSRLIVSLSFSTTVDGEKLVLKGAKLTSSEMLNAFQSLCTNKDLQAKLAAKK